MPRDYVERILRAKVYDVARETPLDEMSRLSWRLGNRVWLKREDLRPVFSFKLRGANNKIANLSELERSRGVIAASAGNHAQGVALAAARLQVEALIVMPETTPSIKVEAIRALGAAIVPHGTSYDDVRQRADELAAGNGMVFIEPFDDPDIIAGQGTVAMEILRQHPGAIDAIFVAAGCSPGSPRTSRLCGLKFGSLESSRSTRRLCTPHSRPENRLSWSRWASLQTVWQCAKWGPSHFG